MLDSKAGEMLKDILSDYGYTAWVLRRMVFRELTNSVREIKSVDDMKNLKIRASRQQLLMECYKALGRRCHQYELVRDLTALQQKTVEGQENPLPTIDAT